MRVLVVSAHPDDEALGCGGTLLRHRHDGNSIHWLIATPCTEQLAPDCVRQAKRNEIEAVAEAFDVKKHRLLSFPAVRLDTVPIGAIIEQVSAMFSSVRPSVLCLPHQEDGHSDHRVLSQAVISAAKPFRMIGTGLRRVLSYETFSSAKAPLREGRRGSARRFPWISRRTSRRSCGSSRSTEQRCRAIRLREGPARSAHSYGFEVRRSAYDTPRRSCC